MSDANGTLRPAYNAATGKLTTSVIGTASAQLGTAQMDVNGILNNVTAGGTLRIVR